MIRIGLHRMYYDQLARLDYLRMYGRMLLQMAKADMIVLDLAPPLRLAYIGWRRKGAFELLRYGQGYLYRVRGGHAWTTRSTHTPHAVTSLS